MLEHEGQQAEEVFLKKVFAAVTVSIPLHQQEKEDFCAQRASFFVLVTSTCIYYRKTAASSYKWD